MNIFWVEMYTKMAQNINTTVYYIHIYTYMNMVQIITWERIVLNGNNLYKYMYMYDVPMYHVHLGVNMY